MLAIIVVGGAIALYIHIDSRNKADAFHRQELLVQQQEKARQDSIDVALVAELEVRRQDSIARVDNFMANLLKPSDIFKGSVHEGFTVYSPSQLFPMLERKGYDLIAQEDYSTTYKLSMVIDNGSEQYCLVKINHWDNDLFGIELEYDSSKLAADFFKATRAYQDPASPGNSTVLYLAGWDGWEMSKDGPNKLSIYFNPGD